MTLHIQNPLAISRKNKEMKNSITLLLIFHSIVMVSQADLVLSIGEPTQPEFNQLDVATFSIEVSNIGSIVSAETTLLIYLTKDLQPDFDEIIGRISIKSLGPNESHSTLFARPLGYNIFEGDYFIGFSIDPENIVNESDENNLICYNVNNECEQIRINPDLSNFWYSNLLPHPVLLIHGLAGLDTTWFQLRDELRNAYGINYGGALDYCLNPDGVLETSNDGIYIDYSDITPNVSGDLYILNLDISKEGERYVANDFIPFNDDFSNQAAIFRQGKALKFAINKILDLTGKDKVVLVGHSMGGLAAREYLQNEDNWQDDGKHHVAKLFTTDSPHGGSNLNELDILEQIFLGADDSFEAVRDLRFPDLFNRGIYLFGGNEADFFSSNFFYNKDVNCNGSELDDILGLNNKISPSDISYSCTIATEKDFIYDIVEESKADLNNYIFPVTPLEPLHADRWRVNSDHRKIHRDVKHFTFGIDESAWFDLSSEISINNGYLGFITEQASNSNVPISIRELDFDDYRFKLEDNSSISIDLINISVNNLKLSVFDENFNQISSKLSNGESDLRIESILEAGDYFIEIESTPDSASWRYPYLLLLQAENIEPIIAEFNSSSRVICNQNTINFSDNSQGEISSYLWSFPGGVPSQSTLQNPTIEYPNSGSFDVSLEIRNALETKTITKQNYVSVLPTPESSFQYEVNSSREVSFENTSNNVTQQVQYEWDFDDNSSSSETNPTHTYTSDGTFTVSLSLSDQCGDSQSYEEIIIETTSVLENHMGSAISIYPNPTITSITIKSSIELKIEIINSLSMNIHNDNHNGEDDIVINFENYPKGTYYILLKTPKQITTKKVVKL